MKKVAVVLVVMILASCTREPELAELVKYMVVQTKYDVEEINDDKNVFNDYTKFFLRADTIGFVSTFPGSDTILLDNAGNGIDFVKAIIGDVAENATSRGFTRVEADDEPDFAINVVVLENFSFTQTVTYPGYYSGYYGYYGGYYGPIVNTYSSNYVTLVIEVVDIMNAGSSNRYDVIWTAYIGDLLTTDDRKNKVLVAVNQAFEQSPYFSKN